MDNSKDKLERLLTPSEVSKLLGVDIETLNIWRATRRYNLAYVKVGRLVRYRMADVQGFIQSNLIRPHNFQVLPLES